MLYLKKWNAPLTQRNDFETHDPNTDGDYAHAGSDYWHFITDEEGYGV